MIGFSAGETVYLAHKSRSLNDKCFSLRPNLAFPAAFFTPPGNDIMSSPLPGGAKPTLDGLGARPSE